MPFTNQETDHGKKKTLLRVIVASRSNATKRGRTGLESLKEEEKEERQSLGNDSLVRDAQHCFQRHSVDKELRILESNLSQNAGKACSDSEAAGFIDSS